MSDRLNPWTFIPRLLVKAGHTEEMFNIFEILHPKDQNQLLPRLAKHSETTSRGSFTAAEAVANVTPKDFFVAADGDMNQKLICLF